MKYQKTITTKTVQKMSKLMWPSTRGRREGRVRKMRRKRCYPESRSSSTSPKSETSLPRENSTRTWADIACSYKQSLSATKTSGQRVTKTEIKPDFCSEDPDYERIVVSLTHTTKRQSRAVSHKNKQTQFGKQSTWITIMGQHFIKQRKPGYL